MSALSDQSSTQERIYSLDELDEPSDERSTDLQTVPDIIDNEGRVDASDSSQTNTPVVSLMEALLREYDLPTNQIFYDNRQVHPADLTPEEQLDIIRQLTEPDPERTTLNEQEATILQAYRQGRLAELFAQPALQSRPVEQWSADELVAEQIRRSNQDLNETEIAEELALRKQSKRFSAQAEIFREQLAQETVAQAEIENGQQQQQYEQELETERIMITRAAREVKEINGFPVTDEIRNHLLQGLLEVDDNGVSPFMQSLADPQEAFKLRYYQVYVPEMIRHFASQIKKETTAAYQRGRREMAEGLSPQPVVTAGRGVVSQTSPNNASADEDVFDFRT